MRLPPTVPRICANVFVLLLSYSCHQITIKSSWVRAMMCKKKKIDEMTNIWITWFPSHWCIWIVTFRILLPMCVCVFFYYWRYVGVAVFLEPSFAFFYYLIQSMVDVLNGTVWKWIRNGFCGFPIDCCGVQPIFSSFLSSFFFINK